MLAGVCMKNLKWGLPVLLGLFATMSCTWVKVSEAGADVLILPADRVSHCKRVGEVNTSVKDDVLGIGRKQKKVGTELDALARNEAVSLEANTLVRLSIEDGRGSYAAYRCPVE